MSNALPSVGAPPPEAGGALRRGGKKSPRSPQAPARGEEHLLRPLLTQALGVLGIRISLDSEYAHQCLASLRKRRREGASLEDLLRVVQWAIQRKALGETYAGLTNLRWLWGASFPAFLATGAPNPNGTKRGTLSVFRKGEELTRWMQQLQATPALPDPDQFIGPGAGAKIRAEQEAAERRGRSHPGSDNKPQR